MSAGRVSRCIVHIGAEKTGTTSIQRYFGRNAESLLARGFWYPRSLAEPESFVHTKLNAVSRDTAAAADIARDLEREYGEVAAASAHTAILSSEFLHSTVRKPEDVERIKAFLQSRFSATTIVYYARRQDEMLASMHSTAVRGGFTTSASALSVYEGKGHYYFDHGAVCDLWAGAFGHKNLICRIYERERLKNGDVVDDFAATIGVDLDPEIAKVKANESLSFETMHALLLLNASKHRNNRELRRALMATGLRRKGARIPMLTRAQAEDFLERFSASNRRFFETYVDSALARGFATGFERFPVEIPRAPRAREVVDFVFGRDGREH